MTWFIDRRLNGKNKSMVNRQRFLRRYKAQIKQSISEAINKRSVTDVDSGESVSIPTEDISEPMFHQGRGGLRHRVHPGNDHFVQNDRIERPQGGGGGSGSGQGQASQAVMFCLMDVSGSMDQSTKDMAKRFYILLYLFLSRTYKNVEVVYIRHHTQAKEVDEHEFFYSQETGGTIVSSALKLMDEVVKERYNPAQWNIYAAQASDGDNWADDSPLCHEILAKKLLPVVRYYSYIEITRRAHQTLWREYEHLQSTFDNFAMQHIRDQDDIYPVFRELFHKQNATAKD
ncbi:YeaH/YhbH family protein [Escherichia coli]